ncbi:MAG TPA: glucose 1-dehydrogenase [Candidatus Baltobacteraceae bacterium]|nr:glucose 1-dehydrogenase [Candidatus Baltobacteraceae bacterium]
MERLLTGKTAIVTGAESGIGAEIAKRFGENGANVAVVEFAYPDWARDVVRYIEEHGGKAIAVHADVGKESEVEHLFSQTESQFGNVDILVNDAGINGHNKEVVDLALELWEETLRTNLTGPFLCSRRFLRAVRDGKRTGGKIVNISSVHETMPMIGTSEYCASKGGLMMFNKTLALEAAKYKVNVNNIAPGAIITPMNEEVRVDPEERRKEEEKIPWGRVGCPDDIASAALFLASGQSDYVTGTTLFVDGGLLLNVGSGPPGQV